MQVIEKIFFYSQVVNEMYRNWTYFPWRTFIFSSALSKILLATRS